MLRGFLVLLGILAAALAAAVVALPRFVDEPALRDRLLAMAAGAVGAPVEVAGRVRLEFAPLPRISADRVRLRHPELGGLEASRAEIDLAPAALLRGQIEPSRVLLVRPEIELKRLPDDPLAAALRALGRDGSIAEVEVVDGTLTLSPPVAPALPREVRDLGFGLRLERERRRATVRASGEVGDGEVLRVDAALEPLPPPAGPASLRLDLAAGAPGAPVTASFQGSLRGLGDALDGKLRLVAPDGGRLPAWLARLAGGGLGTDPLPGGLELAGDLALDADDGLALSGSEVLLAGARARGDLRLGWRGAASRFDATLEASRVVATPELEATLRRLAAAAPRGDHARGRIELRAASLAWRGGEVRRLHAVLDSAPGRGLGVPRLEAVLPGEAALSWTGGEGRGEGVEGGLSLQAGDLRGLLAWLGVPAADLPPGGLTSLDLEARAEVSPGGARLGGLRARVDATQVTGSLALRRGGRPRLEAELAADRLSTGLYLAGGDIPDLALGAWRRRLADLDLALDLAVERFSHGAWRDGELALRATAEAGRVELGSFRLAGEGGAALNARGRADLAAPSYEVDGEFRSGRSGAALRALGAPPGTDLARLLPVALSGRLRGDPEAAQVDARLQAGAFTAGLRGSLGGPFDPSLFDLAGELALPDPEALLAALGWPIPPGPGAGPVTAGFELSRDGGGERVTGKAAGRVGDDALRARLSLGLAGGTSLGLAVEADSLRTALLARAYDLLAAPLGLPAGRPWEWPGAWPPRPLAWGWLGAVDLRLDLAARALRHGGAVLPGAKLEADLHGARLILTGLDLPLAGGRLLGTVTLEREAEHALLGADLRLRGARAERVAGLVAPGSGLAGELDLGARLLGRGLSVADLVGSLEGEGEVALRDGRMTGIPFPPGAGPAPPLEPVVAIPSLEGPWRAARGVVTSEGDGLELAFEEGTGTAGLRFDLLAWLLELTLAEKGSGAAELRLIGAPGRLRPVPPA